MKYIFIILLFPLLVAHAGQVYYPNGKLKKETNYKNGKKHGLQKLYYKSGKLKDTREYYNGKRVNSYFYSTGIKATPTKVTNTKIKTKLLFYGYIQQNNNHFYRAYTSYSEVCDSGNLNGCFYLGLSFYGDRFTLGYDAKKKAKINGYPQKAIKMWTNDCENNDALACFNLGRLYLNERELEKSKYFYKLACDNGEMKGCMGITGKYGYTKEETKQEFIKNYTKACDNGEMNACYWLGRSHDYPGDYAGAIKFYEIGCNNGEMKSCDSIGLSYEWGRGQKKDYMKAKDYYTKACDNDYMFSCVKLWRVENYLKVKNKNFIRSPNIIKKACEIGDSTSCIRLGLYDKACDLGDSFACDMMENL